MSAMKRYPSEKLPKFIVRMPHEVKAWIERQSEINSSSQNSEIVRAIRERMERAQTQERV